jgi:hypothetical protein
MAISQGGNQIIVPFTGTTFPAVVGPPCMMKIIDCWQQDWVAAADTVTFTDSKGRTFKATAPTTLAAVSLGKLDWLEGPITVTQMSSGILYIILGNK